MCIGIAFQQVKTIICCEPRGKQLHNNTLVVCIDTMLAIRLLTYLVLGLWGTCHAKVDLQEPQELFMWDGIEGEENVVTWRNSTGHTREVALTVLSKEKPTALHVNQLFNHAECDRELRCFLLRMLSFCSA